MKLLLLGDSIMLTYLTVLVNLILQAEAKVIIYFSIILDTHYLE